MHFKNTCFIIKMSCKHRCQIHAGVTHRLHSAHEGHRAKCSNYYATERETVL